MPARRPTPPEGAVAPFCSRTDLASTLAELEDLDLNALRVRWRKLMRSAAPPHLARPLLVRIIAYRLQANAFGDLDRDTGRYLDRLRPKRRGDAEAAPAVPPVPARRGLKPGSVLVREHAGTLHRVIVQQSGFAWNGSDYASLSEVARAITGTRWNGPRFFGLRDTKASMDAGGAA